VKELLLVNKMLTVNQAINSNVPCDLGMAAGKTSY
jgi:hypothetical protein